MRLSFSSLLTATAITLTAPAAFAQLAPGPNPLTGNVTASQTLAGGTGLSAAPAH